MHLLRLHRNHHLVQVLLNTGSRHVQIVRRKTSICFFGAHQMRDERLPQYSLKVSAQEQSLSPRYICGPAGFHSENKVGCGPACRLHSKRSQLMWMPWLFSLAEHSLPLPAQPTASTILLIAELQSKSPYSSSSSVSLIFSLVIKLRRTSAFLPKGRRRPVKRRLDVVVMMRADSQNTRRLSRRHLASSSSKLA